MKKFILRMGLAVILLVGGLALANSAFNPGQAGEKTVTLVFNVDGDAGVETILDVTVRTDALMLGELLERVLSEQGLRLVTSGSSNDPFGRFLIGVGDFETLDMSTGPWWMYDSTTNPDCVAAGYCAGIDLTPLYDQDLFTFTFSSSY